jgi:hypothetical protein
MDPPLPQKALIGLSSTKQRNLLAPLSSQNNNVKTIIELVKESETEESILNLLRDTNNYSYEVGIRLLIELAKKQYFKSINTLLDNNALRFDQFGTDENGNTFLHIFFNSVPSAISLSNKINPSFTKQFDFRIYLKKNNNGDTPLHVLLKQLVRERVFDDPQKQKIKTRFDENRYLKFEIKKNVFVLKEKFNYATLTTLLNLDFEIKDDIDYDFVVDGIKNFLLNITNNDGKTPFDLSDGKALTCAPLTSLQIALKYLNFEMFQRLIEENPERAVVPNVVGTTPINFFIDWHMWAFADFGKNHNADEFFKILLHHGAIFDAEAFRMNADPENAIYSLLFPNYNTLYFTTKKPVFYHNFMVAFLRFCITSPDTYSTVEINNDYAFEKLFYSENERQETIQLYLQYYEKMLEVLHNEIALFGHQLRMTPDQLDNNDVVNVQQHYQDDIDNIQRFLEKIPESQTLREYDVLSFVNRQQNLLNADRRFPFNQIMLNKNKIIFLNEDDINKFVNKIHNHFDLMKQELRNTSPEFNALCEELTEQYQSLLNINLQLRKVFIRNQINQLRNSFNLFFDPNDGFDLTRTDAPIIVYKNYKTNSTVGHLRKEGGQTALEQVLETLDRYSQNKESFINTLFIHLLIEFALKIILTMAEQNTLFRILEERCIETTDQTIALTLTNLVKKHETETKRPINLRCNGGFSVTPGEMMRNHGSYSDTTGEIIRNDDAYEMGVIGNIMSFMMTKASSLSNEDLAYFGFNFKKQYGGRLTKKSRNKQKIILKSKKQLKKSKHQRKRLHNKHRTK